ncbi:hypothetical protein L798_11436 [Zootermopsis nevadensis]|uniref:Uncharacterized protein n=1 Tax=Zootermopsis nevadensis TaxID=136037 RepID=A0A067R5U8_ZOONE|nr:hypothetical protein L798_11436 [Zootermopsis nevadensis]
MFLVCIWNQLVSGCTLTNLRLGRKLDAKIWDDGDLKSVRLGIARRTGWPSWDSWQLHLRECNVIISIIPATI